MFRAILIVGLVVYGAGLLKSADPASTVATFETINGAVQNVAQAASPHVISMVDGVLKPAIRQVQNGAEINQNFQIHNPMVERDFNADVAVAEAAAKSVTKKVLSDAGNGCAFSGMDSATCAKWK